MAFDLGWDCRFSSGLVTDPAYACFENAQAYPHTYTNANGDSINAGWQASIFVQDRSAALDPRLGGNAFNATGGPLVFQIDLASGSAPGAGGYTIDLAAGDGGGGTYQQRFGVYDDTTLLIDGQTATATTAGNYEDATLAVVAATTSWTGALATVTFATTTAKFVFDPAGGHTDFYCLAHFRLTLQTSPVGGDAGVLAQFLKSHLLPLPLPT